jgi:AraC-like DNA-binding protein/ligand-binding sensor protein
MNKIVPADFIQQLSRSRIYQDYEQAFGRATKLPLELSSFDGGRQINRVRSNYANPFCAILARTNKLCDACLEIQHKFSSANTSDTQTVTCFAGLTTTSVPVKLEESVIAFLQTGQVFLRTPSAKRFKKIATRLISRGIKVNFARLENAYVHSPVISPYQYRAIVRLLEIFAEHLALIATQIGLQQRTGDPPLITKAKDYVASHQSNSITLEEIARALNSSTFHFCRKFKQATGLTFVQYLSRVRIEKAKILLHSKELRITDIAYEVGFQSLTHFNRIFHKLVGHSPTEYRCKVMETTEENIPPAQLSL